MKPSFSSIIKRPIAIEALFAFICFLFLVPQPYLTIPALDASWQVTLEEAFFKNWEFGTTINFTGGPLSFLYTPTSLGYYVFGQIFAESLVIFISLLLIFRGLRNQSLWIKILAALCLSLSAATGKDGIYLISISAASLTLLNGKPSRWLTYAIPCFLTVLSMMKFSFATLSIACIAILTTAAILQKEPIKAVKLVSTYLVSFLTIWILIGQNPLTIPAFFTNSLQISQGYLWNMNLSENAGTFWYLISFLIVCSLPIFGFCLLERKQLDAWIILLIAAASIYLSWKAGITRAGSHMGFFLQATFVVVLLTQTLAKPLFVRRIWLGTVTIFYFVGLTFFYPGGIKPIGSFTWNILKTNTNFLRNPDALNQTFTKIIPMVLAENELPQIKKLIGDASIDLLHFQQSVLLLNDFNFQPRPTVQNYPAYNEHLSRLNQEHIRKNPPEYILVRYALVDQRYPYSDDTLYNLEVFQNYHPLMVEKGYMLLKRTNTPKQLSEGETVIATRIQSGENVDISQFSEKLLWLKVNYRPSLLHKVCAFLYKPEVIIIRVTLTDGTDKNFRLVGGNLKTGFLLNPLIEGDKALEDFLNSHSPVTPITSFTIASIPGNTFGRTKEFEFELIEIKKEATP